MFHNFVYKLRKKAESIDMNRVHIENQVIIFIFNQKYCFYHYKTKFFLRNFNTNEDIVMKFLTDELLFGWNTLISQDIKCIQSNEVRNAISNSQLPSPKTLLPHGQIGQLSEVHQEWRASKTLIFFNILFLLVPLGIFCRNSQHRIFFFLHDYYYFCNFFLF